MWSDAAAKTALKAELRLHAPGLDEYHVEKLTNYLLAEGIRDPKDFETLPPEAFAKLPASELNLGMKNALAKLSRARYIALQNVEVEAAKAKYVEARALAEEAIAEAEAAPKAKPHSSSRRTRVLWTSAARSIASSPD